jgi:hypothetical protein
MKTLFFVIIASVLVFASCSKGKDGKDGAAILSGNVAPTATIGSVGDFYIDLSTGILYGPKTGTSWGTGVLLQGNAGKNGATILSGNIAPAATLGSAGDFYIDLSIGILYGPKTGTNWGTGVSIQGPQGITGNANVQVYEKDISSLTWTNNSTYSSLSISAPNVLTSDNIANNIILVYVKTTDFGSNWALVPYYTERNIRVTAEVRVGTVVLKKDQDGSASTQSSFSNLRLVLLRQTNTTQTLSKIFNAPVVQHF